MAGPSVTSGIKFRGKLEAAFGVNPTGTFQEYNIDGETLTPAPESKRSNALRADGQTVNIRRVDAEGGGPVNGEIRYGEWDDWFRSVLLSADWEPSPITTGIQIDTSAVAPVGAVPGYFLTAGAVDFVSLGFKVGMWCNTIGFTGTVGNNDKRKIVEVTTTRIYVVGRPALVSDAAGENVTLTALADVTNGTTVLTWALEREDTSGVAVEFHRYLGMAISNVQMEFPTADFLTAVWEWTGKVPDSNVASFASGNTAATTNEPFISSEIYRLLEGDPGITDITTNSLDWDTAPFKAIGGSIRIDPSLTPRKGWGTVGPLLAPGRGDMLVSGTLRLFYNSVSGRDDLTLFDKILNETVSGIAIFVKDATGKGYIFDFPRIKFTGGRRNAPAKSQDVVLELEWEAYMNPVDYNASLAAVGVTARIARHAA